MRTEFTMNENMWRAIILVLSCTVLLVTVYFLSQGITIIFMHLYYLPIVLLAYHYQRKGVYLSVVLGLFYIALVAVLVPGDITAFDDAVIRVIVFIVIAALVAYLAECKQEEKAFREISTYNRSLIEASIDPLVTISRDGKIRDVNSATEKATGLTRNELVGTDFSEYFVDPQRAREGYLQVFSDGKVLNYPLEIRHRDGHTIPVLYNATVYHDSEGNIREIFAAARDITKRKQIEDALRKSEEKYRLIADNTADNIRIFDMDFRLKYISPSVRKMKGFTVEESMAMPIDQMMTPKSLAALLEWFNEEMEREATGTADPSRTVLFETEEYCKDGSTILVENSAILLRDADGRPHSILGISRDITERKRAEEALHESEEKYRLLAETSPEMIYFIDTEGYVQYVNPAAVRMFHAAPDELCGKHVSEIFPPEQAWNHLNAIREVVADRTVLRREITEEFPAGRVFIEVRLAPVINTRDQVIGVLGLSNDITPRKTAEEQRECLIQELAQKNAELDRFTYTVSHDLKSPLLSIRAFLTLLEGDMKSGNTGRVTTDIRRITESTEKLEHLITTLLALSRSGKAVDVPVKILFADLAREAATLLDASLKQRGVTLVIPESMPVVAGDRQRLLQVMTNLLDNAIKFMGDQNEPRVEVGVLGEAGAPVIYVRDNGMGIKEENLVKVFGLYERFNPEVPGTGIGLATVKRIIEAHGGKVWMESEGEGKGTTFWFTLPGAPGNE